MNPVVVSDPNEEVFGGGTVAGLRLAAVFKARYLTSLA